MIKNLSLTLPDEQFAESYWDFVEERRQLGEKVWQMTVPLASESTLQFVARLLRAQTAPEPGLVAETTYWALLDKKVVGRIALRHALNKNLEEFGGHIGYEVRPSVRRSGIATEMLRLVLQTPKAKEMSRVLLTCSPDNTASIKTILKNGGLLFATKFVERVQRQTQYYWIERPSSED